MSATPMGHILTTKSIVKLKGHGGLSYTPKRKEGGQIVFQQLDFSGKLVVNDKGEPKEVRADLSLICAASSSGLEEVHNL